MLGSIEEVWHAVASGPGLTSWFVPTEVDGRLGGEVLFHFGAYGSDICEAPPGIHPIGSSSPVSSGAGW